MKEVKCIKMHLLNLLETLCCYNHLFRESLYKKVETEMLFVHSVFESILTRS